MYDSLVTAYLLSSARTLETAIRARLCGPELAEMISSCSRESRLNRDEKFVIKYQTNIEYRLVEYKPKRPNY